MGKYMVKVNVELIECNDDAKEHDPVKDKNGSFSMTISERDAISIDNCERAVLQVSHSTIRDAISEHLSKISKKKALEKANSAKVTANPHPYKVDGEIGRFEFTTHSLPCEVHPQYNTARDLFPELRAEEFYRTIGFKEIAMILGCTDKSYRKTATLINRIRYQEQGGTPYRTLQENTEKEGSNLIDYIEEKTKYILKTNNFGEDGIYHGNNPAYACDQVETLAEEKIAKAVDECFDSDIRNEVLNNPVGYEHPEHTVNISIDDVNVKRQEEHREKGGKSEKGGRKYVHNTIAHVSKEGRCYTLNGYGIKAVLCSLIAFVFNNNLIVNRLQFFTDGHKILNESIFKCFKWFKNIGIILDWYHLEKKCKEQLSMAMKGRDVRNDVLERLMPFLWNGLTDKAIALLEELEPHQIKNQSRVEKLIQYLHRNKPYIPCYAIRKQLGLCNSSSIGEKMNDLLVSDRQKHNGMSWSKPGSVALASVTVLKRNHEINNWFEKGEIEFKLAANSS